MASTIANSTLCYTNAATPQLGKQDSQLPRPWQLAELRHIRAVA
ncbi:MULTISPECIES: hypothetical protein [Spongiibacter]|nr:MULTISPECIES: hypothetical protein [Spongiibacter]